MAWLRPFLFSWWIQWHDVWDPDKAVNAYIPYVILFTAILGFGIAASVAFRDDQGFWRCLGSGILGAVLGCIAGGLLTVFVIGPLPYWIVVAYVLSLCALVFAPVYYAPKLLRACAGIPAFFTKGWGWLRKRVAWRRKPTDYLSDLDQHVQDVDRKYCELQRRKADMQGRISNLNSQITDAERINRRSREGSAAEQIAADLYKQFCGDLVNAQKVEGLLDVVMAQIQEGKSEMRDLITLARLAREASERRNTNQDVASIEAARASLAELLRVFELTDTVLAAMVAKNDMDLDLAFRQAEEGIRRSGHLQTIADSLQVPPPSRVQA